MMKKLTLKESLVGFIDYVTPSIRNKPYGKVDLTNILLKQNSKKSGGLRKQGMLTLIEQYHKHLNEEAEDNLYRDEANEALSNAIFCSFTSYTRSKNSIMCIYNDYIDFLKDCYGIEVYNELPEEPIPETTLQRQIAIVKMLHHTPMLSGDIADVLYISERAVTGYLNEMQSANQDEGLVIDGKKVEIKYDKKSNRYQLIRTVHPIMLALNLRQVIAVLEGLRQTQSGEHGKYAYELAKNIYDQLSDYGKKTLKSRIISLNLSPEWYRSLKYDDTDIPIYRAERDYFESSSGQGDIDFIYCIKSGREFDVSCIEEDIEVVKRGCKIIGFTNDSKGVKVMYSGHVHEWEKEKITEVRISK